MPRPAPRQTSSGRKECRFCQVKAMDIDYKRPEHLRRYLGTWARILPRQKTGVCARHQRRLDVAIKRARHLALMPFTTH